MSKHLNEAVEGDDGGLVICRGCKARGTYAALPSGECPTPYKPNSVLLKESLAREQALQQRLTVADERWDELVSAVRSINRSPHYMVKAIDDDQPQYRQRKEWIDWVLELCDAAPTSSERSNKDYAIEHAEYMAQSADDVLAKFQAYGLALLAADEGGDDGEDELFENIDSTRGDLQESLVGLRSMVYEFRKRSAKT